MTLGSADQNRKAELQTLAADCGIPAHMQEGVAAYIVERRPTGDFLRAVISNDLRLAVAHADPENRARLAAYVTFFFNYAPAGCWGSVQEYEEWINERSNEAT